MGCALSCLSSVLPLIGFFSSPVLANSTPVSHLFMCIELHSYLHKKLKNLFWDPPIFATMKAALRLNVASSPHVGTGNCPQNESLCLPALPSIPPYHLSLDHEEYHQLVHHPTHVYKCPQLLVCFVCETHALCSIELLHRISLHWLCWLDFCIYYQWSIMQSTISISLVTSFR